MKRKNIFSFILMFVMIFIVGIPSEVHAETTMQQFILDGAGLLSDEQANNVNATLKKYSEKNNIDIAIITTDSLDGMTKEDYGYEFIKQFTGSNDFMLLTVSMVPGRHELDVAGYGLCKDRIPNNRCTAIYKKIKSDMSKGNYEKAFTTYAKEVNYYTHHKYSLKQILIELIIALIIAVVCILVMIGNAGGRKTTDCDTYLDPANSRLLAKRDRYLRTSVSKRKIEKSSSSSSGSSGGSSSGSHGGGSF